MRPSRCSATVELTAPQFLEFNAVSLECPLTLSELTLMVDLLTEEQKTQIKFLSFSLGDFSAEALSAIPRIWSVALTADCGAQ